MKVGILGAGAMVGSVIAAIRCVPGVDHIDAMASRPERVLPSNVEERVAQR